MHRVRGNEPDLAGFKLVPWGVFARNPPLDVPVK